MFLKYPIFFSKFSLYENFNEAELSQRFYQECRMCTCTFTFLNVKNITIQFTKVFLEKNNSSTRIMSEVCSDLTIMNSFMTEVPII